ncbi:aldo/keto reductase [Streptomyces sp. NPDC049954]|uniref:aldo/keto reductase n=1 Tax=Streptomyces sp. NPDC049954 TaxID=3155779 RepID=UPI003422FD3B
MRGKRLGKTDVEITEVGFGGGPLGGLFQEVAEDTAAEALEAAWAGGVRYFDTAPHYGIGQSERRVGAFLRTLPRDTFTFSTKVGRLLVPQDPAGGLDGAFKVPATHRRVWDFTRDGIRRSVEDSLGRTGLDRIDVLYLHDAEDHFEDALREGFPALAELRAEGVVGAVGAGMHDDAKLSTLVRETDTDVVMLSGRWTLLEQRARTGLLPLCAARGVSVVAASVFNSGVLAAPQPPADASYDYAPATPGLLQRVRRIAEVCEAHGVNLPQAAMAFPLRHPAVAGIVLGMRTAAEVRTNLSGFGVDVPDALWPDLRAAGLILDL